jgi:hypothetical protein
MMIKLTIVQAYPDKDLYKCELIDGVTLVSATKEPVPFDVALLWAEQSADLYQVAECHLREHE